MLPALQEVSLRLTTAGAKLYRGAPLKISTDFEACNESLPTSCVYRFAYCRQVRR